MNHDAIKTLIKYLDNPNAVSDVQFLLKSKAKNLRKEFFISGTSTEGLSDARVLELGFKNLNVDSILYFPCCYYFGFEEVAPNQTHAYRLCNVAIKSFEKLANKIKKIDAAAYSDLQSLLCALHLFSYICLSSNEISIEETTESDINKMQIDHYYEIKDDELKTILDISILKSAADIYQLRMSS